MGSVLCDSLAPTFVGRSVYVHSALRRSCTHVGEWVTLMLWQSAEERGPTLAGHCACTWGGDGWLPDRVTRCTYDMWGCMTAGCDDGYRLDPNYVTCVFVCAVPMLCASETGTSCALEPDLLTPVWCMGWGPCELGTQVRRPARPTPGTGLAGQVSADWPACHIGGRYYLPLEPALVFLVLGDELGVWFKDIR